MMVQYKVGKDEPCDELTNKRYRVSPEPELNKIPKSINFVPVVLIF